MSKFTVVYDACVLYPAPIRDLLMQLAKTELFRARWTDRIHDEWIRSVLANRSDLRPQQLQITRENMNKSVIDCLVVDYEELIEALQLPDQDDRHVLAAAIKSGASEIVTFNLKDFPLRQTSKYGISAIHPDDFILNQIYLSLPDVLNSVLAIRKRLKNPPKSAEEYLDTLHSLGLVKTVDELRKFQSSL